MIALRRFSGLSRAAIRSRTARSAAGTLALRVTSLGLGFAVTLVLARALSLEQFGIYSYVTAWAFLLVAPGILGLDTLVVRRIAAYTRTSEWNRAGGLIRWAFRVALATSVVVAFVAVVVSVGLRPGEVTFWLAMLLIPVTGMLRISQGTLVGLRFVISGQIPELVIRPVLLIAFVAMAFGALGFPATALTAVALHVAAAMCALIVAGWVVYRRLPVELRQATPDYMARTWLASSVPLMLLVAMRVVISEADVVMLGSFVGAAEAGLYRVAARAADLIGFVLAATNLSLAPRIAGLYAAGEVQELQRLTTAGARGALIATLPIATAFIVFGQLYLLLFGREFVDGYGVLVILSVAQLVSAAVGSVGMLLTMTGHERDAARGLTGGAVSNVALNLVLIPSFGVVGAAIGTATSIVLWNVILAVLVRRRLGLRPTAFRL